MRAVSSCLIWEQRPKDILVGSVGMESKKSTKEKLTHSTMKAKGEDTSVTNGKGEVLGIVTGLERKDRWGTYFSQQVLV